MPSLLPTPEPADPVEGQPGHFEHSNWLKASVKALDAGAVHKAGDTMTGKLTAEAGIVALGMAALELHQPGKAQLFLDAENNTGYPSLRVLNQAMNDLARVQCADPGHPDHAATKRYVDSRPTFFSVREPTGLNGAADWLGNAGVFWSDDWKAVPTVEGQPPTAAVPGWIISFAGPEGFGGFILHIFVRFYGGPVFYNTHHATDGPAVWQGWKRFDGTPA